MKDLYDVLGVARGASADDVRKAYRKAARKYHPDVNPGDQAAEERFKDISVAYDVLGDEARRKQYDEFGEDALKSGFDPDKAREYARWREGRARTGHPFASEAQDFDLGDLADLFGGFPGARGGRGARSSRGADVHARVELDFVTAIRGTEVQLAVPLEAQCRECAGAGVQAQRATACAECGGSGQAQVARGPMRMVTTCRACGGRGKTGPPCSKCAGTGRESTTRTTRVRIPPGAADGDTLRIAGKGMPGGDGGKAGDLIISTHVKRHPLLRRDGLDLHLQVPVTLDEIYNGASIDVPTLDGHVKLTVPPRSQSGTKLRLRGKGVERGKNAGDLYVELALRLPSTDDEALAEAAKAASALYGRPVREGLVL